jgi:receptor expression-enhancing protein 5/6
MIGWWGSRVMCMCAGVIWPAYKSYQAIKTTDKEDDTLWLTYWVVFSLFSFIEFFLDIILVWLPLYYELKFCFILWMTLPYTNGALLVWQKAEPVLDVWVKKIEEGLKKTTSKISAPKTPGKAPEAKSE